MQTNCNFYILENAASARRFFFCCALIEKLFAQKRLVYIHCKDEASAEELHDLLWTYKEESFIPHCILGEFPWEESPIQMGWQGGPVPDIQDVVIFLTEEGSPPDFYAQFERIVEIVSSEDEIKKALRMRFQFYKAQGIEVTTHTLKF